MNQDLLTLLESFNRKDRYFVVAQATGNATMRLGSEFRAELGERIGLSIPQSATVYLDYHLDWLFAAKAMVSGAHDGEPLANAASDVVGSQEDIDLLVAFRERDVLHLILLEARAETG